MNQAHIGTARDACGAIDSLKTERCTACGALCVDYHLSGTNCTKSCPCPLQSDLYCSSCCPCCNDAAQLVLFKANDGAVASAVREERV